MYFFLQRPSRKHRTIRTWIRPDPNWAKILDPDPFSIYLDPQHWFAVYCSDINFIGTYRYFSSYVDYGWGGSPGDEQGGGERGEEEEAGQEQRLQQLQQQRGGQAEGAEQGQERQEEEEAEQLQHQQL